MPDNKELVNILRDVIKEVKSSYRLIKQKQTKSIKPLTSNKCLK